MHYGFVYRWTNTINGKKYIGSHKGTPNDGYTGSGTAFRNALKKYGRDNFTREILEYASSREELVECEQKYLTLFECSKRKDYYNINPAAARPPLHAAEDSRIRMSKNNPNHGGKARLEYIKKFGVPKGRRTAVSDEERKNISARMKTNNPVHGIEPWDRLQATEQSLTVWEKADAYYSWWCDNTDKSYYVMFKALGGYEKYTIAHVNMIKRFKAGWNPNEDTNWKEFKERRNN